VINCRKQLTEVIHELNVINDTCGYFITWNPSTCDDCFDLRKFTNQVFETIYTFSGTHPNKMKFINSSIGYVAFSNTLKKSTDGGTSWNTVLYDSTQTIRSILFPTESTGYLLLNSKSLYKTTDSGNNWVFIDTITNNTINDFEFQTDSIGYAIGWGGFILKTIDGGLSWFDDSYNNTSYLKINIQIGL